MDLTKLTLEKLRGLARKHLKRGYSKLSKAELVSALKKFVGTEAEEQELPAASNGGPVPTRRRAAPAELAASPAGAAPSKARGETSTAKPRVQAVPKPATGAASKQRAEARPKAPTAAASKARAESGSKRRTEAGPKTPAAAAPKARAESGSKAPAEAGPRAVGAVAPSARAEVARNAAVEAGPKQRAEVTPTATATVTPEPSVETAPTKRAEAGAVSSAEVHGEAAEPVASMAPSESPRPLPPRSEREEIAERAVEATLERPIRPDVLPPSAERVKSSGGTPAEVFSFSPPPRRPQPPAPPPSAPPPPPSEEEVEPHFAEPLVEGFFVARIAGEGEARRHHMIESLTRVPHQATGGGYDEHLGELPSRYDEDRVIVLPRDPSTMFAFWCFREETLARAAEGLDNPRLVMRVFDDRGFRRQVDIGLQMTGYYLHSMESGRAYRVEIHFVSADGRARRVDGSSNRVLLPWFGPSDNTEVRFMRIPPHVPVDQLRQAVEVGTVGLREGRADQFLSWQRTRLPHSATLPGQPGSELGPGFVRPDSTSSSSFWTPPRSESGRQS